MQNVLALAPAHAYNNISFARRPLPGVFAPLWGRVRAVVTPWPAPPSAGWGRAKAKADAPSRSNPHLPAYGRAPARLRPNHCAQRRKCTRQSSPPPVRPPRFSPPKTAPLPAYGRTAVRKGGSAQGQPRPRPCVLPASARLRPRPCLPTAESLCAKAEVHKAIPAPARAYSPRQLVYRRAPAA